MVLRKSASPNRPQPTISQSLWHVCLRMKCSWEEGRGKSFTAWEWVLPKIHVNALLIKAKWWVGSWGEICRTVEVHRSPGRHSRLPVYPNTCPFVRCHHLPKGLAESGVKHPTQLLQEAHCYARFFPFQCVRWTRYTIKLLISGCAGSPCLFWEGSCHTSQVPLVFWFITPCVALCFPAFLLNLTAFSDNVALAQSGRCVVSLASVNLCWPT